MIYINAERYLNFYTYVVIAFRIKISRFWRPILIVSFKIVIAVEDLYAKPVIFIRLFQSLSCFNWTAF